MPTLILTKIFPGDAQQFRASMMRLINNLGREGWLSSDHRRLVFGEYPYMNFSYFVPAHRDVPYRETFSAPVWKPDVDEVVSEITRPQTRASWQVYEWNKASMRYNCHPTEGMYSVGMTPPLISLTNS